MVGIVADLLGGGIIGINAAALTAAAFAKRGLVMALINKDLLEKENRPTPQITGIGKYSILAFFILLIYLVAYTSLESLGYWSWILFILRTAISLVANLLMTIGLFIICNPKKQ